MRECLIAAGAFAIVAIAAGPSIVATLESFTTLADAWAAAFDARN